jgi:hypothetical protein
MDKTTMFGLTGPTDSSGVSASHCLVRAGTVLSPEQHTLEFAIEAVCNSSVVNRYGHLKPVK